MEIVKFWGNEFAFAMMVMMAVGVGIAHFIRVMLAARWHIRQVDQTLRMPSPLNAVETAVAVMNGELPMNDRVRILGMAFNDAAMTADQARESLEKALRGAFERKAGRAAPSAALAVIEEMEAEVVQPPLFWAVQGLGGRWMVLYETDGAEMCCFPRGYPQRPMPPTEIEARCVAAVLNQHDESRRAGRPMLAYDDYEGVAALILETGDSSWKIYGCGGKG